MDEAEKHFDVNQCLLKSGSMSSSNVMSRRERRRRQNGNCEFEDNEDIIVVQKNSLEKAGDGDLKDSRTLARKDTFTVPNSSIVFDNFVPDEKETVTNGSTNGETGLRIDLNHSDSENSKNLTHTLNVEIGSGESNNLTYKVCDGEESKYDTYNVHKVERCGEGARPIPAPRRRQTIAAKEPDKNSSDTDKDIMEIEADDSSEHNKTESLEQKAETVKKMSTFESDISIEEYPKPKPRKLSSVAVAQTSMRKLDSLSKSRSLEEINVQVLRPRSTKSNPETKSEDYGKVREAKPVVAETGKEKKGRFAALLQRRKQKKASKMFSSVIKLERARIPTISSILKDLKDDSSRAKLEEEEEDKFDLQIESPRLPQSAPTDKMYVQYKNGFYVKKRDDVFKQDGEMLTGGTGKKRIKDSFTSTMLRTAMMFQKYWSRAMMYFHGLVAGFGFAHAFAITAVLFYFNHDLRGFIGIYACLALKIHFIFYMLIVLCIISCLDRLDIGDCSTKHWQSVYGTCPSLWLVFFTYISSFILTFVNHSTESKFDSYQYVNITGENLWDPEVYMNVSETFSCWYRIVWARDVMVLVAWLLISLTDFPDNLYNYVKSLASKIEIPSNGEARITAVV